jgi:hypothetical protein
LLQLVPCFPAALASAHAALLLLYLLAGITGGVISHSGFEARFFGHVST